MRCLGDTKILKELIQLNSNPIDMWVCDYELKQSGNQKLRDITPTKVQVSCPYGSGLEFHPYTKTGKLSKNKIDVWSGNSYDYYGAHIFNTEEEAIEQYNNCIWEQIKSYENEISELQERKLKLEDKFINTDIVMETLVRN